ncbi:MAG TPA: VOC family protein [Candidatus Binataceae bacterium]|nr:VOC family protein [Candidatus Binataceae bacterium]
MASVTQMGYLGLNVSDVAQWERFATEILGLQAAGEAPDGARLLRMDENHHRFILQQNAADDLAFIGWEVSDEPALRELAGQLRAAGVEVRTGSPELAQARGVVELLQFKDPNGIASEAYFGPLMNFQEPFQSPRPISGFETGIMGLGHMVIRVDDAAQSLHFYRDLLGMKISDLVDMRMRRGQPFGLSITFLHCNPRHHTLAFGQLPGTKRLHHFMLQVRTIDDVCSTMYLCEDRGVPIAATLGRHTNDHMVSFYLRTPSGFEVEYGYGARVIDDAVWKVQRHESGSIWGHRRPR